MRVVEFSGVNGSYEMELTNDGQPISCSCPGFSYRGECKHVNDPDSWIPIDEESDEQEG